VFESLSDRLASALRRLTNRGTLQPEEVDAALREVRLALLEADVNYRVVKQFNDRIRERIVGTEVKSGLTAAQQVVKVVHEELVELLGGNREGLRYAPEPPTVVMLVGLQGSGKTTTTVKLATLARREGRRPLVTGLDLRRPAAVEQLQLLAEREQLPFTSGKGAVEDIAAEAVAEAGRLGCDVVILDTAGRLHLDAELMDELKRLRRTVPATETLLVADAMTGQEAVNVGSVFQEALGLDGVILTKLDGDARGGAALSLRMATGARIRFAGVGERAADLEVFHADRMASRILGMGDVLTLIEKAERSLDQEEARQVERSLASGQLTFDDFLVQMRQIRAMGSVRQVLEMLPGGSKLLGDVSADPEAELRRSEAIILSMTRRERARPEIIDGSRRRRIAKGSGVEVTDVNRLLKSRQAMQQLLKQLGLQSGRRAGGRRPGLPRLPGIGRMLG
jgi:signal recognition particle subunit SRP54